MRWQDFLVVPALLAGFYFGYKAKEAEPLATAEPFYSEVLRVTPGEVITKVEIVKDIQTEIEYIPIEIPTAITTTDKAEFSSVVWINPDTIPETSPIYHLKTGGSLAKHLIEEHVVNAAQIEGWSEKDLIKLHSYIHNGHTL